MTYIIEETNETEISLPAGFSIIWHQYLDKDHLLCDWYAGHIADVVYEDETHCLTAKLYVQSGLRAEYEENGKILVEVNNKYFDKEFYHKLNPFIKNDIELQSSIEEGKLHFEQENCLEYVFYTQDGQIVFPYFQHKFYGNLNDGIKEAIKGIQMYIQKYNE